MIVQHQNNDTHRDEGDVQKRVISINRDVRPYDMLYISIWAENAVSLETVIHGSKCY